MKLLLMLVGLFKIATPSAKGIIVTAELWKAIGSSGLVSVAVALLTTIITAIVGNATSIFPDTAVAGSVMFAGTLVLTLLHHLSSGEHALIVPARVVAQPPPRDPQPTIDTNTSSQL